MRGFPSTRGPKIFSSYVYSYKNIANMIFSSTYKHSIHFIYLDQY